MEKIKLNLFFLIWSAFGLLITILIWDLPWRFQVNDDEIMMWLISGAYTGTPETYTVFIHPILSWILAKLYTQFPLNPWYPIAWFAVIYFSYLVLVYSISKHAVSSIYRGFLVLVLLGFTIHFLFFLQFTQVAGFAALGGFLTILNSRRSYFQLLLGGFLLVVGSLIRMEAMFLVSFGFVCWAFFNFKKEQLLRYSKKIAPVFLVCLLLAGGKSIWEKNSDYSDFLVFNQARSSVIDHPVFYRKVVHEEISKDSPWFYFSRWFFEEGEIDIDQLEKMKSSLDTELFSLEQLINTGNRIVSVQSAEAFKSFLWIVLLFLFLITQNPRNRKFLACWLLGMVVLNHFFLFYGRVNVLFLLVLLIPIFFNLPQKSNKTLLVGMSFVLIFGMIYHTMNFLEEGKNRAIMDEEMQYLVSRIDENHPIFLEGYQEHMFGLDFSVNNQVPFINQGWLSRSPFQKEMLKKYDVEKPSELSSYSLLAIRMDEPVIFPDYMKHLNPSFQLVELIETNNFQLLKFAASK